MGPRAEAGAGTPTHRGVRLEGNTKVYTAAGGTQTGRPESRVSEPEIALRGGTHGPVVRIGDTVRRVPAPARDAIHALLRHLELVGFTGAPRCLGLDDQGREILTFIDGEVAVRLDGQPLPDYVRSDSALTQLGRLTRELHDATVGFEAPPGTEWSYLEGAPRDGEVICHNDLGPWNTVFRSGAPVAFIDWDGAAPAPRMWDVAYAVYRFVPFVPDEICSTILGWNEPPERLRRTQIFCDAYAIERSDVFTTMERRIELMIATGIAGNADGDPRFGDFWMTVMKRRLLRDLQFVRSYV